MEPGSVCHPSLPRLAGASPNTAPAAPVKCRSGRTTRLEISGKGRPSVLDRAPVACPPTAVALG